MAGCDGLNKFLCYCESDSLAEPHRQTGIVFIIGDLKPSDRQIVNSRSLDSRVDYCGELFSL